MTTKLLPVKSCNESYIFTHTIYEGPSGERTLSMRPIPVLIPYDIKIPHEVRVFDTNTRMLMGSRGIA